jgi:hypothetical protein
MHEKEKLFISILVIGGLVFSQAPYLSAMDGPEDVELEALVSIYEPVAFDHTMHEEVTSCATCHHHTTGLPAEDEECLRCHKDSVTADEVTCTGCHPANPVSAETAKASSDEDLFHIDTEGLKRAYHLKCLGCHTEMDAPSGCEDCHPKKDGGGNAESAGN